jgi:hypothetical protein
VYGRYLAKVRVGILYGIVQVGYQHRTCQLKPFAQEAVGKCKSSSLMNSNLGIFKNGYFMDFRMQWGGGGGPTVSSCEKFKKTVKKYFVAC